MSKMLTALREQRSALADEAAALLDGEPTAEALETVEARHASIADLDAQIKTVEATEARAAEIAEARKEEPVFSSVKVGAEPMTYSEHGERSYFKDLFNAQVRNDRGAWDGLYRHAQEVAVETRDISRVDGAGGEFVPPAWLLSLAARTLRPERVASKLATSMALPAGTDSINLPTIKVGTQTGSQNGDNTATTTRDMQTGSVEGKVITISGYEDTAIQLVEQSPLAGGLDRLIFEDLMADYDLQVNTQYLNGSGTAGDLLGLLNVAGIGTVTYTAGTATGAGLADAVAKANAGVFNARFREADGLIMSPSTWFWLLGQSDSQGRPLVVPANAGPMNAMGVVDGVAGGPVAAGTFGTKPVFVDATMPKTLSSNQTAIIAAKFSDSVLMEGGIRTRVLPDVKSANLTIRFQVYAYATSLQRYPQGVVKVVGSGLAIPAGY